MSDLIPDKYKGWIKDQKEPHLAMFDDPDFGKCYSCRHQIEPFRMCEWAERGGDGVVHLKCPRWERKEL